MIGRVLVAAIVAISGPPAGATASDPLSDSAPSFDSPRPDAQPSELGEYTVNDRSGAVTYSIPIVVPPGRQQTAPSLALVYSSQGTIRGGVADGWALDISKIRWDATTEQFIAELGPISGPLVEVNDASISGGVPHRLERDDTGARFEHLGKRGWVVYTKDGHVHRLGNSALTTDHLRWLPSTVTDRFGNTVQYNWAPYLDPATGVPFDFVLDTVQYSSNVLAGLGPHALVEFQYDQKVETCDGSRVPIGARVDYRGASAEAPTPYLEGSHKLIGIRTYVKDSQLMRTPWRRVRELALRYDDDAAACDRGQSPRRVLAQVQWTAWSPSGIAMVLPPTTFEYIQASGQFAERLVVSGGYGHTGTRHKLGGELQNTLLDMDGDGFLDRVRLQQIDDRCRLLIASGPIDGIVGGSIGAMDLPLMPWRNAMPENGEHCTLSGQYTLRATETFSDCTQNFNANLFFLQDYDGDGRTDLITAILADSEWYDPNEDDALADFNGDMPPECLKAVNRIIPGGAPDWCAWLDGRMLLQERCGRYLWRFWRNTGTEFVFERAEWVPIPILPDGRRTNLGHGKFAMASSTRAVVDLDGDRRLDLVVAGRESGCPGAGDEYWSVFRGRGDGTFEDPFCWPVPTVPADIQAVPSGTGGTVAPGTTGTRFPHTRTGLLDVNGDSLPDLVTTAVTDDTLRVFPNYGAGFLPDGWPLSADPGAAARIRWIDRSRIDVLGPIVDGMASDATRQFTERTLDVDGDGLPDRVTLFPDGTTFDPEVRFNVGDVLLPPVPLLGGWLHAERITHTELGSWRVLDDVLDATGDGRLDFVMWNGAIARVWHDTHPDGRPGLLSRVDNHQGGTLEFKYASTLERSVVAPTDEPWPLPQLMWVVRQTIETAAPGASPSVTDYRYAGPTYGSESGRERDPRRFLGFEYSYADLPPASGATGRGRIERRYEYKFGGDLEDQRGRLVETWVYNRDGAGNLALASYEKQDYAIEPLFDGRATFVHPSVLATHTCSAGDSVTDCMTSATNALYQIEIWTPWPDATSPKLYLREGVEARQAPPDAPLTRGDRATFSYPEIWYGDRPANPNLYFIAPQFDETREVVSDASGVRWQQSGQTITANDPVYALPIQIDVYFDEVAPASTLQEFDTRTGNLVRITKPVQVEGSGASQTYQYDTHALFISRTVNELGHLTDEVTDVGTGALTLTRGPNVKVVATGLAWQETRFSIDGFGRVLERYVSLDHPAAGYVPALVERTEFNDWSIPTTRTDFRLRDFLPPFWLITRTEFDGLGRVTTTRTENFPSLTEERIVYGWDRAGNLSTLSTPDPRVDTGALVTTTFEYDALSRPTRLTRPDGSGLSREYDGFIQTHRELTADDTGATTVATFDKFGLLAQVDEIDGVETATTTYVYDGEGNLLEVMDADGNQTTIAYDWAGNRTSITSGDRVWRYGWNLNGNLVVEIPPVPTGAADADYTTLLFYDDLDRVALRMPGLMGRTPERRAELGIGTIVYSYDGTAGPSQNAIGRLSKVTHLIDDPRTPGRIETIETEYTHLARGLVQQDLRRVDASYLDDVSATQWVFRTYNALDLPVTTTFDDGTSWITSYDSRGLPGAVDWYNPATAAYKRVATLTNSLARQVRERLSPVATGFGQRRRTTFDVLGRPLTDEIHDLSPLTLRASRTFGFNDSGDLTALEIVSPATSAAFSFGYDKRHRLRNAIGALGYAGTWTYSRAGNILTANVAGPAHPRSVTYAYGAIDPQAVDQLTNPDGTPYAAFAYDAAGNMVMRTVPEGSWTFAWDNEDALREATGPSGTEAYWYDHSGARVLALSATGSRLWFAESETNIDANDGERRWIHVGGFARVEDQTTIEVQYADHLLSTNLVLGTDGAPIVDFVYTPWGDVLASSGAIATHRRRFNGKENDERTGLNYYGFRYYDPLAQRWTSSDPLYRFAPDISIGSPTDQNLYAFAGNNAVRYLDPDGRARDPDQAWVKPGEGVKEAQVIEAAFNDLTKQPDIDSPEFYDEMMRDVAEGEFLYDIGSALWDFVDLVGDVECMGPCDHSSSDTEMYEQRSLAKRDFNQAKRDIQNAKRSAEEVRAKEVHGALKNPVTRDKNTTAVTKTEEGITIVSSNEPRLRPEQRKVLKKNEVEAKGKKGEHAEVKGVKAAKKRGLTPTKTAASRPICKACAKALKAFGVKPTSPLK